MAYKTDETSRRLNLLLNKDSEESRELKDIIIELVQFSVIIDKKISEEKAKKTIELAKKWNVMSSKQPTRVSDFQMLKQRAEFDLMSFINYEVYILSSLDFFDIQADLKRYI